MAFQEVITPHIDVPVPEGIIASRCHIDILVEFPGMNGPYHRRDGMPIPETNGIAEILVIGHRVVCPLVDDPPRVRTPEEVSVTRDGTIHVQGRRQIGELEAVFEGKVTKKLDKFQIYLKKKHKKKAQGQTRIQGKTKSSQSTHCNM